MTDVGFEILPTDGCATCQRLYQHRNEVKNDLVETEAILEAIMGALKGDEPSDFMRSFPDVEHAWWIYRLAYPNR